MNYSPVALNVAEKPSVAKKVTELLNKNQLNRIESLSKFNPVFQFDFPIRNTIYTMRFTSVRGHLMNYHFPDEKSRWILSEIKTLYDTEILRKVNEECNDIRNNLIKYARNCNLLILWLDCDREGEAIAFEVVDLVKSINPCVQILRAHFSALTFTEISRAISNLVPPNKNLADAVEIRQRIDLLIGATFTRLQTLSFKSIFYNNNGSNEMGNKYVISYGPCQFPTLNFIVERSERIRKFVKEDFYYIELKVKKKEGSKTTEVTFNWERNRLFDLIITTTIFEKVLESKKAKIISVNKKPITRFRPLPLNTVEMQKLISKKLKINSHTTMDIAEKLYQKGLISYPRTETNVFNPSINLLTFIEEQKKSSIWGNYASRLLDESDNRRSAPRKGQLDDKAHPPIHPVKFPADYNQLEPNEKRVYELLVRRFLACVSVDAKGQETVASIEQGDEKFHTKGLIIDDIGYLEVYIYEKWNANYIPDLKIGDDFVPSEINLKTGSTSPPNFLTESELITLMDKNGIGTDATIHEHIKTIQDRCYATFTGGFFKPTLIGTCLIKTYEAIGIEIYKPHLRAQMERDMKNVCDGRLRKDVVLADMKSNMYNIFNQVFGKIEIMKEFVRRYLTDNKDLEQELFSIRRSNEGGNNGGGNAGGFVVDNDLSNNGNNGTDDEDDNDNGNKKKGKKGGRKKVEKNNEYKGKNKNDYNNNKNNKGGKNEKNYNSENVIGLCPKCKTGNLRIILAKTGKYFIGCSNYPHCKNTKNFDENPSNITKTGSVCSVCSLDLFSLEFEEVTETKCLGDCFNSGKSNQYKNNNANYNNESSNGFVRVRQNPNYNNQNNQNENSFKSGRNEVSNYRSNFQRNQSKEPERIMNNFSENTYKLNDASNIDIDDYFV